MHQPEEQDDDHMGLCSGSIEDITRMEPWEIRKAKK